LLNEYDVREYQKNKMKLLDWGYLIKKNNP